MSGFPPAPAGQVTLANWRTAPFNTWAFHHVRELIATADIANEPDDENNRFFVVDTTDTPWTSTETIQL